MSITIEAPDLLSVAEAAKQLNKPRLAIYRWVKAGKMLSVRLGGIIYIPRSELDRLAKT